MRHLMWALWTFSLMATLPAQATIPLNPTILMFSFEDAATCPQIVEKAFAIHSTSVLFLPTLGFKANARSWRLNSFCSIESGTCLPLTAARISDYEDRWQKCFAAAYAHGMKISILPHIDDGGGTGIWRNLVKFDPSQKYLGFSYRDIMIDPLVRALEKTVGAQTVVDLSLQGEMGATVFSFPNSYLALYQELKQKHPTWQFGLSLNHGGLDGSTGRSPRKATRQITQTLFGEIDFMGISAYHPVHVPVVPEDFDLTISDFRKQLQVLGVVLQGDKIFQFSEIAIGGGGQIGDGMHPAKTPAESAIQPWSGINKTPYVRERDPWIDPAMRDFRRGYYQALLSFLARPVSESHTTAAFTWNVCSWDATGFGTAEYGDSFISDLILHYNQTVK